MIDIIEYNFIKNKDEIENYLKENKSFLLNDDEFITNLIKYYNAKFYFVLSFDENRKINGILFFYMNQNKKDEFSAFTFYDSFIFNNENIAKDIISEVQIFNKKNDIKLFHLYTRQYLKNFNFENKKNFIIPILNNSEEQNWNNKPSVFRTEVRKAHKRNFIVENKILFPIEDYYNLYLHNQLKKKIPIHNKEFFTKLFHMKSNYVFSCVKNGVLAGYAVININRKSVHLLLSNISQAHLSNGVNQLIYWEIINFSSKNAIDNVVLGPSKDQGSTAFFKKKIGGEEHDFKLYNLINTNLNKSLENQLKINYNQKIKDMILKLIPKFILKFILKKKRFYGKIF